MSIDVVEGSAGTALELAQKYEQESVLVFNENRDANLIYANGDNEHLGRLHCVDKEVAVKFDAYTFDGKYYWVCY